MAKTKRKRAKNQRFKKSKTKQSLLNKINKRPFNKKNPFLEPISAPKIKKIKLTHFNPMGLKKNQTTYRKHRPESKTTALKRTNLFVSAVCSRRKLRRKMLFMRHIVGKGKGSRFLKPKILNPTSYIKCKR